MVYLHLGVRVIQRFAPESALEDLGLLLGGPGMVVVQLLGLQGPWKYQVLRGASVRTIAGNMLLS